MDSTILLFNFNNKYVVEAARKGSSSTSTYQQIRASGNFSLLPIYQHRDPAFYTRMPAATAAVFFIHTPAALTSLVQNLSRSKNQPPDDSSYPMVCICVCDVKTGTPRARLHRRCTASVFISMSMYSKVMCHLLDRPLAYLQLFWTSSRSSFGLLLLDAVTSNSKTSVH